MGPFLPLLEVYARLAEVRNDVQQSVEKSAEKEMKEISIRRQLDQSGDSNVEDISLKNRNGREFLRKLACTF